MFDMKIFRMQTVVRNDNNDRKMHLKCAIAYAYKFLMKISRSSSFVDFDRFCVALQCLCFIWCCRLSSIEKLNYHRRTDSVISVFTQRLKLKAIIEWILLASPRTSFRHFRQRMEMSWLWLHLRFGSRVRACVCVFVFCRHKTQPTGILVRPNKQSLDGSQSGERAKSAASCHSFWFDCRGKMQTRKTKKKSQEIIPFSARQFRTTENDVMSSSSSSSFVSVRWIVDDVVEQEINGFTIFASNKRDERQILILVSWRSTIFVFNCTERTAKYNVLMEVQVVQVFLIDFLL